jgi:hypothetical protein
VGDVRVDERGDGRNARELKATLDGQPRPPLSCGSTSRLFLIPDQTQLLRRGWSIKPNLTPLEAKGVTNGRLMYRVENDEGMCERPNGLEHRDVRALGIRLNICPDEVTT